MSDHFRVVKYTPTKFQVLSEESREASRAWLDLAVNSAKFMSVLSPVMGLILLASYLRAVGAPMLIPDPSTILILLLITAGYTFLSFFVVTFVYMPVYTCYVRLRTRDLVKTRRGGLRQSLRKLYFLQTFEGRRYNNHKSEFVVFHASSTTLIACLAFVSLLNPSFDIVIYMILVSLLAGLLFSVVTYEHFGLIPKAYSGHWMKKFRLIAIIKITMGGLTRSIFTLAWSMSSLIVLEMFVVNFLPLQIPSLPYYSFGLCVLLMLLYLILTDARVRVHRLVFIAPALLSITALFAPSSAGGIALRFLGIGGGFPILMTVKSTVPGRQETTTVDKMGCLIIRSSSETMVKTFDGRVPTVEECVPSLIPGIINSGSGPISMFSQVEVFPNSQVVQIKKLSSGSPPASNPNLGTFFGTLISDD